MGDYKSEKEAFVADNPGSSAVHINAVSAAAFTAYALYAFAARRWKSPVLDWLTVVFPLLLAVTLFAERTLLLNGALAAFALAVAAASPALASPPVDKPAGRWLAESDSEDETAAVSAPPRSPLSPVKLPSQLVAEVRELDRAREQQDRIRVSATASGVLGSPTTLEPIRRRASPSPTSPDHAIDIGTSPPVSPQNHSFGQFTKTAAPPVPIIRKPILKRDRRQAPQTVRGDAFLPFLSVYRAHMMIMTVHCILAVDFPVFPRVLGKCENFGTSLMDMGVGSFVFSLGVVSSRGFNASAAARRAYVPALAGALRRAAPVLLLGLVRLLMVKGSDYPEHLTEYGVHWNFFFTLGLVPAMATAFLPARRVMRWSTLGFGLALAHQVALSGTPLQDYLLGPARAGLLGANKEGLASLPGYGAVFLLGLSIGEKVMRAAAAERPAPTDDDHHHTHPGRESPDPDRAADRAAKRKSELALELAGYAIVSWGALAVAYYFGIFVSRRFANLPYVVWTVAFNATSLAIYLGLELWLFPQASPDEPSPCPPLLEAVNKNGLAVFLAANLLTGLVNVTVPTMYTGNAAAMAVLAAYSAGVCALAWALRNRRIKI